MKENKIGYFEWLRLYHASVYFKALKRCIEAGIVTAEGGGLISLDSMSLDDETIQRLTSIIVGVCYYHLPTYKEYHMNK